MTATFRYEAYTRDGAPANGEIVAESLDDACTQLGDQKLIVVSVTERKQAGALSRDLKLRPNHVKLADVAWMARNLATSQSAGLSMFQSMGMLSKQKSNTAIGRTLGEMHQQVADGMSLSATFRAHEAQLGQLTCALVAAGEASGRVDEALTKLADITEARLRLRRKIVSAVMYPALVLGLALAITFIMLLTVVPTFAGIFKQFGDASLPAPTQFLLSVSGFLRGWWFVWVPVLIAAIVGAVAYRRSPGGRRTFDRMVLKLPIFGRIFTQTIVARAAAVLSSLLGAGVSLLDAMELCASVAGNAVYSDALLAARDKVREGRPLSRALGDTQVFPDVFVQLCAVGEETGAVSDLLGRYSKATEEEVQTTVDGLSSLLEPLLIVVLGVIVGGIVIALYMPLFDVINKIQ